MKKLIHEQTIACVPFHFFYVEETDDDTGEEYSYYFWERKDRKHGAVGYASFVPFSNLQDAIADAGAEVAGINKVSMEKVEALIADMKSSLTPPAVTH